MTDQFKKGTSFETVHDFYVFDKKLRIIISDALERIEVAVRSRVANALGTINPLAHRDPANFHVNFTTPATPGSRSTYDEWLSKNDRYFNRSREDFAEHFRLKYQGIDPAIWVSCEAWDWGMLSYAFDGLPSALRQSVATPFNNISGGRLASWLRHLNDVRNVCAHHSRLWNRQTASPPLLPKAGKCRLLDHIRAHPLSSNRLYVGVAISAYMMRCLYPKSRWHIRFMEFILEDAPLHHSIDTRAAGFPPYWYNEPLWR